MTVFRRILLVAAVCFGAAAVLPAADPSPWDAWRLGYTNYELGEQGRNRGDYIAALEAFEKSRQYYQAVKRARPDWNQKVIRERLTACEKQIAELRNLMGNSVQPEITPPGAPPAGQGKAAPKKPAEDPRDTRYKEAQGKIAVLEHELAGMRADQRKKRDFEREMAKLTLDIKRITERNALLEKTCRKLQAELKKPDSALTELRAQLIKKDTQLENNERIVRSLEERLRSVEQRALETARDRNLLRNQLQQATEERARMEREVALQKSAAERLQTDLEKSSRRLVELGNALKAAEEKHAAASAGRPVSSAADVDELIRLRSIVRSAEARAAQFQESVVALRKDNSAMIKRLQELEAAYSKADRERIGVRGEAAKLTTRIESLVAELSAARDLQRRQESELKRVLEELDEQKKRLSQRNSDDFKALVEARSRQTAQDGEINELKGRISDLELSLAAEKKSVTELQKSVATAKQAYQKLLAEKAAIAGELETLSPDAAKFRELYPRYETLTRNFEALRKENQENRLKLAAASPREAELKRIKLRLTELERLKTSLGREQRLTAELTVAKKRLEQELEVMRGQGAELALAKKQLENLKALQREVQDLRKVNREAVNRLETMKKMEDDLVSTRKSLIESGAAQLELHELKSAYAKVLQERNSAATEAAKLRDELIAMEESLSRERNAAAAELEKLRRELASREKIAERELNVAAAEQEKLRNELVERKISENKERRSAAEVKKHGAGLAMQLEKSKQQLRDARQRIEQLETLLPQLEQLKKLNDELMYAKSFEAELIRARSALGELNRYKDELAGVIKLNETLVREKSELEKELARRPRLPQSEESEEQLKLIRAARREKPGDFIADGMLAESKGSTELAIWNYRKALSMDRENAEASEHLGKLLLKEGDYDEAANCLATARAAAPERLDLALATSRAYLGQKRFGNARAIVETFLKQYPENGELLTVAALAFADEGNYARAESCLRLALRYLPKGQEQHIELARLIVHHDASRMEEASRLYEEARMLGAKPDPELEPILGPRLDKRRELEAFLTSAMNEAFENRDYRGAVWYCRQLLDLNRRPEYFTPMLALARYLGGETGAARETLTFNAESVYGALVLALIELKDGNRQAMSMALRRAASLNGNKKALIDAHWRNLGYALDAAKTANPAVAGEFDRAYQWEQAR